MSSKEIEKRIDTHDTAIQLIQQEFGYMKKGISDLNTSIKELGMSINNGFVTKEQFERLRSDVDDMKNLKSWAFRIVIGAIIVALLSLVLVKV